MSTPLRSYLLHSQIAPYVLMHLVLGVVVQVMPESGSNGSGLLSGSLFQSWLRSWYTLYSLALYGAHS